MRSRVLLAGLLLFVTCGCAQRAPSSVLDQDKQLMETVQLPEARLTGPGSIEESLANRRSIRDFADENVSLDDIGQLLWAGQGITDRTGKRTAPSAGALYPIELYAVSDTWVAHYLPADHEMERRVDTTILETLGPAAFGQEWISSAPIVFVITGVVSRTQAKYGGVGEELMIREAGHVAQNMLLQATALGLGAVPVGGFDPEPIEKALGLTPGEQVLYLLPVGVPA